MINGYEDLYVGPDGSTPKYKLFKADELVHNVSPAGVNSSLGIGYFTTYFSMLEQNIGQQNYKILFDVYKNYHGFTTSICEYQDAIKHNINMDTQIKGLMPEFDKLEKRIEEFAARPLSTLSSFELVTYHTTIQRYKELKKLINDFKSKKVDLRDSAASIQRYYQQLAGAMPAPAMQVELMELRGLFKQPEFKSGLAQDYVDSMLLPGAEKLEHKIRLDADSKFDMAECEMQYLTKTIDLSKELLDFYADMDFSKQIPFEMLQKYKMIDALHTISTVAIEESSPQYTAMTAYSKYYSHIIKTLRESSYGKVVTPELESLTSAGIRDFKIPGSHSTRGVTSDIAFLISKVTGKNDTLSKYNSINDFSYILDGVAALTEAQQNLLAHQQTYTLTNPNASAPSLSGAQLAAIKKK